MWVQFLDGLPPNIWDGEKRSKSGAIFDNFRLWSWISPERIHKSKTENVFYQLQHLLHWAKICWWTLVHKQKNYWRAYWPTEVDSVWETIFWPLQRDVPSIFLYALEIAEDLLTHTQTRTGVPPKKKDDENLEFGLKFSVCTPITSGLAGIFSPNFSRPCDELWSTNETVIARMLIHPNCSYIASPYGTWFFLESFTHSSAAIAARGISIT